MLGFPMGMGMVPELNPDVLGVWKKFLMTNFTMPNKTSSMKYAVKSVPGLADVGIPQGDGDGSRAVYNQPNFRKILHTTLISMKN